MSENAARCDSDDEQFRSVFGGEDRNFENYVGFIIHELMEDGKEPVL